MNKNTCCFFGHRYTELTTEQKSKLYNIIQALIVEKNINTFLFGSKSQFDDLCYQIVSELKINYPYLKRIYVRAQSPYINDNYKSYLLKSYEDTYYPNNLIKSGRFAYIKRNYEMINESEYCVIYFDKNYIPTKKSSSHQSGSGTKIAYDYALKNQRKIINIFDKLN